MGSKVILPHMTLLPQEKGAKIMDIFAEITNRMIAEMENAIGTDRTKVFHSHFSKIMFTEPGGEKKHLTFDDNQGFGPDYEPLMEIVAKKNLSPIFVCESAGTQDKDALTMKNYYLSVK
jgi:deoxyribonuclease-4